MKILRESLMQPIVKADEIISILHRSSPWKETPWHEYIIVKYMINGREYEYTFIGTIENFWENMK